MGACAMLPRIIGQGRAAELLYTGRVMTARRASAGASSTLHERAHWKPRPAALARASPPARPSPMA
jgi:enoyl-CoA hydratase/carnithine racemase